MHSMNHNHGGTEISNNWFNLGISLIFLGFIIMSLYRKLSNKYFKKRIKMEGTSTIKIEGMSCNHCVMNVDKAVKAVAGVTSVDVNLASGTASIVGSFNLAEVEKAVEDVGYKIIK